MQIKRLISFLTLSLFLSASFTTVAEAHSNNEAPFGSHRIGVLDTTISIEDRIILWALNQQEASGREWVRPRYEANFYKRYLKNNPEYFTFEKNYGSKAISSSYGPWQIMFSTAVEMGYRGEPQALSDASVSLPYVLKYIQKLKKRFPNNTKKVVSAYNAGPGGVGTNPVYTNRVLRLITKAPQNWNVYGTSVKA